jgi:hypothetical protein
MDFFERQDKARRNTKASVFHFVVVAVFSRSRYVILLALAVVTGSLAYLLRGKGYWLVDNLGGNLAAGFLGSLAVLFFIERAIENKRKQERMRLAALALSQMWLSLQRIVILFAEMLKASAPKPLSSLPSSLQELFSHGNTSDLDWLDLDGPTGHAEHTNWKALVEAVLAAELDRLAAILDRYLPFLDVQLVESIDSLTTDCFLGYLRRMRRAADALGKLGVKPGTTLYGTSEVRDEFFARLLAAGKQVELAGGKPLTVPTSLIREDMMPKAGQARLRSLPAYPALFGHGDPPVGGPQRLPPKHPAAHT